MESNGETYESLIEKGKSLRANQKYEEAIHVLTKVISLYLDKPKIEQVYFYRGVCYAYLKKEKEAIDDFQTAILYRPHYAQAYHNIGVTKAHMGKYYEAIDYCNKAIENYEKYYKGKIRNYEQLLSEPYNTKGAAYANLGKYKEALINYNQAAKVDIEKKGTYVYRIYNNIGLAYVGLGNYDKALENYDIAIKIIEEKNIKNYLAAYINKANILCKNANVLSNAQDYQEAEKLLEKALLIDSNQEQALYAQGVILYENKNFKDALNRFDRVIKQNSRNANAYLCKGAALSETGHFDEAISNFKESLRYNPLNTEASLLKDIAYIAKRKPALWAQLIELSSKTRELLKLAQVQDEDFNCCSRYMKCNDFKRIYLWENIKGSTFPLPENQNRRDLRLSLSSAKCKNDLEEGQVLNEYIFGKLSDDQASISAEYDSIFLLSFSYDNEKGHVKNGDNLLMWQTYGRTDGQADGISVTYEIGKFKQIIESVRKKESEAFRGDYDGASANREKQGEILTLQLHISNLDVYNHTAFCRIIYYNEEDNTFCFSGLNKNDSLKTRIDEIREKALGLKQQLDIKDEVDRGILNKILGFLFHLVKRSSYEHENEIRLLVSRPIENERIFYYLSNNVPGIFTELDCNPKPEMVTLGPGLLRKELWKYTMKHAFKNKDIQFGYKSEDAWGDINIKYSQHKYQ